MEIYVDDDTKLTLHGLQQARRRLSRARQATLRGCARAQYYVKLQEAEKNRKLNDLLDALDFNQVVIFVSKVCTRLRTQAHPVARTSTPFASGRARERAGPSVAGVQLPVDVHSLGHGSG